MDRWPCDEDPWSSTYIRLLNLFYEAKLEIVLLEDHKIVFKHVVAAFILTSCHKNILASFFTPTPIIVLMDNVMKFKFFSSIILTNCHKNNIKPLCILSIMSIIISSLFHHSFFFQTVFKKLIFMGEKRRWFLYDLMHAKTIVRLVT